MGGSGGGMLSSSDLAQLEEQAKKLLKKESTDANRHVFISFANEDKDEVNLLRGQAKNDKTDLQFDDYSVKEPFDSKNADYIKSKIKEKIERTSVTIVYLSTDSGISKWVDWEIRESLKQGKGVIGVYKGDSPPSVIPSAFKEFKLKSVKWSHDEISRAVEEASRKR